MLMSFLDSLLGKGEDNAPPQLVLVPPLFERDHRGRSRMANSSYDWLFAKPALRWLFNDYMEGQARALVRISPGEDPRISITARFASSLEVQDRLDHIRLGKRSGGSMAVRFQPDPAEPLTFIDADQKARLRFCWFDTSNSYGVFATMPLLAQSSAPEPSLGMRYSTPQTSAGAIVQPVSARLDAAWWAFKQGGFTYGAQLRPAPFSPLKQPLSYSPASSEALWDQLNRDLCYAVSYSPEGGSTYGKGTFTASVEVQRNERLVVSFLHHQAAQRLSHNPFEARDVVGVTSFLDLGLQVSTSMTPLNEGIQGGSPQSDSELQMAAAWQANKNLLLKGKVGTAGVSAALALKAWWQPSFWVALALGYGFKDGKPKLGLTAGLENYGNIRYERAGHVKGESQRFGRALVQRHVALPGDIANQEGRGVMVRKESLDDPHILGQVQSKSSSFL
eukprot:jgi/Astpho2/5399/Aster-07351